MFDEYVVLSYFDNIVVLHVDSLSLQANLFIYLDLHVHDFNELRRFKFELIVQTLEINDELIHALRKSLLRLLKF